MASSQIRAFDDPCAYMAAIRAAEVDVLATRAGNFSAELMQMNLRRLWLQRGSESLPGIMQTTVRTERMVLGFLADGLPIAISRGTQRRSAVIEKLETFLAAHHGDPVYLAELCAAAGVSERTLRIFCHEQFGMGPMRFLWLRRMHNAHRALAQAATEATTVTEIATGQGFWELGRFSVEYHALFGEPPSATLRQPAATGRVAAWHSSVVADEHGLS